MPSFKWWPFGQTEPEVQGDTDTEPEETEPDVPAVVRVYTFAEPPAPRVVEPQSAKFKVEMEMGLHALCGLFGAYGWQLARPGKGPQPSAEDLAELLTDLADETSDLGSNGFATIARFLAINTADFPGDTDLYLYIGTATKTETAQEEESADA